jgi:alkylated DNA repair dioxygenase AlkB
MVTLPPGFELHRLTGGCGLGLARDLDAIVNAVPWRQETIRMFGKLVPVPRLTAWFGDGAYTYSGIRHTPAPLPPVIAGLRAEVEGLAGVRFNSVLANRYRDGSDSVAWHADDESELGAEPTIASLSLGAPRRFSIRHNASGKRWDVILRHGDVLVMSGRSQADYQHAIPKTRRPVGERTNLTFRTIHV